MSLNKIFKIRIPKYQKYFERAQRSSARSFRKKPFKKINIKVFIF